MRLKLKDVECLEIDGIDTRDYPDFCDAYFSSGINKVTGEDLTDLELDELTEDYSEVVHQMVFDILF